MVFLKEYFTLFMLLPIGILSPYAAMVHHTEESVALYQSITDEHWGTDGSRLMESIFAYSFDRHFQIARSIGFRFDATLMCSSAWSIPEKTGNIQDCIEVNDRNYQAMESYMRAAPSPNMELSHSLHARGVFFGIETHHQHLQPRQNIAGVLKYMGINDVQQAEEGYRSSAESTTFRSIAMAPTGSSADGLTHLFPEHALVAQIRALLSFSVGMHDTDLSWLDGLPPADATTLYCTCICACHPMTPRVLVAEVFELQGRHADAIRFAQTDLQDCHNFNVPAKVRAGRVLGRCHAALGQHALSVSVFDAAIELAHSKKLLLSEALSVRGRALSGRNGGAGGSGVHWDEATGKQRLTEVMGRMQGPRDVLERALLLPQP
jgi:hypothetical protein